MNADPLARLEAESRGGTLDWLARVAGFMVHIWEPESETPFIVLRCNTCGLGYEPDPPDAADLAELLALALEHGVCVPTEDARRPDEDEPS